MLDKSPVPLFPRETSVAVNADVEKSRFPVINLVPLFAFHCLFLNYLIKTSLQFDTYGLTRINLSKF